MIDSRVDYIHQNPVKAGIVEYDYEYMYSSARGFSGMGGLLELDEL